MSQIHKVVQEWLPKHALTRLAFYVANGQNKWWVHPLIRWFIKKYQVDMTQAQREGAGSYNSFNDFFTRALKPNARPIAGSTWVSPADGCISSAGSIEEGKIFQAKGKYFSAKALVSGDEDLSAQLDGGHYVTVYLSPRDYHRVHMPIAGRLISMTYVAGELFSVNTLTAHSIDKLFARNERVILSFDTEQGLLVMVLVGAAIVGSIATKWHGVINASHGKNIQNWQYQDQSIVFNKGDEVGHFQLGSTVILLLENKRINFFENINALAPIRQGQALAN